MPAGALILVATPIGNLGDLSPRAVEVLSAADLICCEDTRRSGRLLAHAGVAHGPLRRVDAHTEAVAATEVVRRVADGETVALVTDAGTPGISDPGSLLVRAAVAAGLTVSIVPGPAAAVAALVLSGLDTSRFVVEGFLPRKGGDRTSRLAEIAAERRTVVVHEAPSRTARTLADLAAACAPERRGALARELTKLHEEIRRGTLAELADGAGTDPPRGEVLIVIEGAPEPPPADDDAVVDALRSALGRGLHTREAATEVAAATGRAKRAVYALALEIDR